MHPVFTAFNMKVAVRTVQMLYIVVFSQTLQLYCDVRLLSLSLADAMTTYFSLKSIVMTHLFTWRDLFIAGSNWGQVSRVLSAVSRKCWETELRSVLFSNGKLYLGFWFVQMSDDLNQSAHAITANESKFTMCHNGQFMFVLLTYLSLLICDVLLWM